MNKYQALEAQLDYIFSQKSILHEALTHSSYANEKNSKETAHNERLEFLGDSILSLAVSDYLFHRYPNLPEGELTKIRASVVCEPTLAEHAQKWQLGNYMTFGRGEALTGGRERPSILADAFEAVIAAIYLDGGFAKAQRVILNTLELTIQDAVAGKIFLDYKTAFQEHIQASTQQKIQYHIVDTQGPDHKKTFLARLTIDDTIVGEGSGRSKKEAEQGAAKMALHSVLKQKQDKQSGNHK